MTCLGTLLRTVEEMDAQLPGAVAADDNSDTYIRVPGGWRSTVGFTVHNSQAILKHWGPLCLTSKSPLDEHLADPEGIRLVEAIHTRKADAEYQQLALLERNEVDAAADSKLGMVTRHSQMEALPVGTVLRDQDGDKLAKGTDGRWRYTKLDVQLATGTILATFGPLQVVVQP